MLHLLDANVLIDANRDYYPISHVAPFWRWLEDAARATKVAVPLEIYEEVKAGSDDLATWIKQPSIKGTLVLNETISATHLNRVLSDGYAPDLTDSEIEGLGRDPFIVAYALVDTANRVVVTTEVSKPRATRQNRRLPDVCADLGVRCVNTFQLIRALDFRLP